MRAVLKHFDVPSKMFLPKLLRLVAVDHLISGRGCVATLTFD